MPAGTPEDIAFEAAMNERYLVLLEDGRQVLPPRIAGPANTKWTGTGKTSQMTKAFGPLAARVGLDKVDDDLGRDFYIGARRAPRGRFDAEVVSWAAPVAQIFYDPANCTHELVDRVIARRSLITSGNRLVSVFDEWADDVPPSPSPFERAEFRIAPAPRPAGGTRRRTPPPTGKAPTATPATREDQSRATTTPLPASGHPASRSEAQAKLRSGMRSAESVDYTLSRPRTDALQSLLATLQPDQYDLITARPDRPLLIQGHPGTGKSIIALHRAAYLVDPTHMGKGADGARSFPKSVLFVGPTEEWRQHVEAATSSLDHANAVSVQSLPGLLGQLAQVRLGNGGGDPSLEDMAQFVYSVASKAARAAEADPAVRLNQDKVRALETVYEIMRSGRTPAAQINITEDHTKAWMRSLPPFSQARGLARYRGVFAAIGRRLFGREHRTFDHIIVDEAQDVSGLEWVLLRTLNRDENWTLVGDMNQRRNDFVDSSWERIADRLYLGSVSPRILERGYRSTQPILDFAKPLLPRNERTAMTLQQEGPPVKVERSAAVAKLGTTAVAEARALVDTYPTGTVAVIAANPEPVLQALRTEGWRRSEGSAWSLNGQTIRVLTHITSRGVEFDGVVVVEPAEFPQNLGRIGPLYTSLTRANRELVVVHHRAMPDALRRYNRR